jgi:hypothetical protein
VASCFEDALGEGIDMRILRPVGWVIVGVVIGALSSGALVTLFAKQDSGVRELGYTPVGIAGQPGITAAGFLREKRSGGCWLLVHGPDGTTVAAAPEEACK